MFTSILGRELNALYLYNLNILKMNRAWFGSFAFFLKIKDNHLTLLHLLKPVVSYQLKKFKSNNKNWSGELKEAESLSINIRGCILLKAEEKSANKSLRSEFVQFSRFFYLFIFYFGTGIMVEVFQAERSWHWSAHIWKRLEKTYTLFQTVPTDSIRG